MSKQPEALRLADASDNSGFYRAPIEIERAMAAELRRLHSINAELLEALQRILKDCEESSFKAVGLHSEAMNVCRAAIRRATEEA